MEEQLAAATNAEGDADAEADSSAAEVSALEDEVATAKAKLGDYEKEMEELKATLDGPNSDARGHSFEIQPACLLQTKRDEFPRLTNA